VTTSGSGLQLPDICAPALPRLLAEHGERLSAETVLRCLAICHDELHHAGVRAGLNHAAEAMARTRLRQPPNPLRTRATERT
jgi:hypothetical protein